MNKTIVSCIAAISLSMPVWAQGQAAQKPATGTTPTATGSTAATASAAAPDLTKMGPWTRKATNEKQTRKEIEALIQECEELAKKGDFEGAVAKVDFPVFMVTDDAKGNVESKPFTKEEYTAMMKPFYTNMPKDMKTTHKPTITVLSDSLALVSDDFTMTLGKQKLGGKSGSLLIKKDGAWKWKMMSEAGWGGQSPAMGGSGHADHDDMKTQTQPQPLKK